MLRWQTWLLKQRFERRALFGEFTWENILRGGTKGRILGLVYRVAARTSDFAIGGNSGAAAILKSFGSPRADLVCRNSVSIQKFLFLFPNRSARGAKSLPVTPQALG